VFSLFGYVTTNGYEAKSPAREEADASSLYDVVRRATTDQGTSLGQLLTIASYRDWQRGSIIRVCIEWRIRVTVGTEVPQRKRTSPPPHERKEYPNNPRKLGGYPVTEKY
jgi:hypothetical protein